MAQLTLMPACVLPGCRLPTEEVGHPCADCRALFAAEPGGWRLVQHADVEPMTETEIEERDEAVRAAQRAQYETPGVERKQNQRCWLCEQRRTCTRQPAGWECDECAELT